MPDPALVERIRDELRAFRTATTERAAAEAAEQERYEAEQGAINTALPIDQRNAEAKHAEATRAAAKAFASEKKLADAKKSADIKAGDSYLAIAKQVYSKSTNPLVPKLSQVGLEELLTTPVEPAIIDGDADLAKSPFQYLLLGDVSVVAPETHQKQELGFETGSKQLALYATYVATAEAKISEGVSALAKWRIEREREEAAEQERLRVERKRKEAAAEQDRLRAERERKEKEAAERERIRTEAERLRTDLERLKAEVVRKRAAAQAQEARKLAERERQAAETARQRIEQERHQRRKRLTLAVRVGVMLLALVVIFLLPLPIVVEVGATLLVLVVISFLAIEARR